MLKAILVLAALWFVFKFGRFTIQLCKGEYDR